MDPAAHAIADIVLVDSGGEDVRLADLWQDRTVVINWLRHYG